MARRESFEGWHLPGELDGVVLREDRRNFGAWLPAFERHAHEELEVHFVERGSCTLSFASGEVTVEAGWVLWVPPGREHIIVRTSGDLVRWILLCRKRLVRRVLPAAGRDALLGRFAKELLGSLARPAAISLRQTFSDVRSDCARELPVVNAGVGFALARAWLHFQSGTATPEPSVAHPAVAAALALLRAPGARMSMRVLAKHAGVTESHLSKLFAAEVGVTITDYRNRLGVERFLELYADGSGPTLLEAALDAGFGSYAQFYRVFHGHMGYPPAEHRARVRVGRATVGS